MRLRLVLLAAAIALSPLCACFLGNSGADKKIGDTVHNLNDQARWGRINDAAQMVEASYRDSFLDRHRLWGNEIQLADTEVLNIQLAGDAEQASAYVNFSWYAMRDMTLHETTLKQNWSAKNSHFVLSAEAVVRGDPGLFAAGERNPNEPVLPSQ